MAATYVLISSQVLATTATSVTFSSIPQTYTDLKLVMSTRETNSGLNFNNVRIQFNGDTTSNYSSTTVRGDSVNPSSTTNSSAYFYLSPLTSGSISTANTFGSQEIYFPNYTSTTTKQNFAFGAGENNTTSAGSAYVGAVANLYRGTSAITSMLIDIGGNTIAVGSSFYLYGIRNS